MKTRDALTRMLVGAAVLLAPCLGGCAGTPREGGGGRAAAQQAGARQAGDMRPIDPQLTMDTVQRVADWQLAHPAPFGPRHWAIAPLYDGLIDASLTTGDPRYLAAVIRAGRRINWEPGPDIYHADDQAAAHAWLRIHLMDPAHPEAPLRTIRERIDEILANPVTERLSFTETPRTSGVEYTDRWTWADALYMAPPVLALLGRITGDHRYLDFVDQEFKAAYDALFDPAENLFYRDARFIDLRTPGGRKVFWSRGNGWVYAGLTFLLDAMPADDPSRAFYLDVFRRMSPAVRGAQQPDGFWYPNLADPAQVPVGETSGTSLFLIGLAWGVRLGVLDHDTYWPSVQRGWNAVLSRIGPNGGVGFVQPIGARPERFRADSVQAFGTGAVLMAGSEILRALGADAKADPAELFRKAEGLVPTAPDLSARRGQAGATTRQQSGAADRAYCVGVLTRIAEPVLDALSKGELKTRMPIRDWERHRAAWTHYEAFARTLAGIAPWLELGPDDTAEGRLRARFIDLARKSLINAADPRSPDHMNFGEVPDQPLVESAYLAFALMVAPHQLWDPLDATQRANVLDALRTSRKIKLEHNNNWYLFPAMIEAALWQLGGEPRIEAIDAAVAKCQEWYVGDGVYGDGPEFHADYYNSYVIHPMLLEVLRVTDAKRHPLATPLPTELRRARRYAQVLERLISPEGTFPVMGRSSAYRFGAFGHLAYMALRKKLPDTLAPGAVRGGITAVVRNMVEAPGTFDEHGWLNLGAVGSQPGLREDYNSTGSLYICLIGLAHLGLPPDDPFWTAPPAPWTQKRIWAGKDVPRDVELKEK